jgi:cytochrome b561
MFAVAPAGYRASQIQLHWTVFALVVFQFLTGDNMTDLFRATHEGPATPTNPIWTAVHIVVGLAILMLMIARLALRQRYGAPPPPASETAALRWLASAVHIGLYADLIGAAVVGLLAYFLFPQLAGLHHLMTRPVLLVLVGLHVLGALYQFFVLRSDVVRRMLWPIAG